MSKSIGNLKAAFVGESQANRRYAPFAKKAEDEGFKQITRLFRATSEAEAIHAYNSARYCQHTVTKAFKLRDFLLVVEAKGSMRRQSWLSAISNERNQIPILIVYCFMVGGWTLRIFPDPHNEMQGLTIFEWIYRKADSFLHKEDYEEAQQASFEAS